MGNAKGRFITESSLIYTLEAERSKIQKCFIENHCGTISTNKRIINNNGNRCCRENAFPIAQILLKTTVKKNQKLRTVKI